MIENKIIEHMSYDWMIVAYFFLGGISAGSYIFSVVATYWKKEFLPFTKKGAIIAPISLAIGMTILLFDLGMPLRSWRLFATFNPTSALSWGIWFLNIFFVLSLLHAWSSVFGNTERTKVAACIGLPFSLLVGAYTGVLLCQAPGRALWHSPLNPPLFLLGGVISGLALVFMFSLGSEREDLLHKLGRFVAGLVLLEVGLVLVEILILLNGGTEEVAMAERVLYGSYAFLFWIVEILAGAAIPVMMLFKGSRNRSSQALASLLILTGIFTMRYIVVIGGQVPTF